MKSYVIAFAIFFLTVGCLSQAFAHGVKKVRRELIEKGYEQLEFQRTRPPFKLDACLDGERYHLHVDYYGKMTEKTHIGSCEVAEIKQKAKERKKTATVSKSKAENCEVSDEAAARAITRWGVDLRSLCNK